MNIEQFILMNVVPISILLSAIIVYEKNYMIGIDSYIYKFRKKHNVYIDKAAYCRFESISRVKTATSLLILNVISYLLEVKDSKTMMIILVIWGLIDGIFYYRRKKRLIATLSKSK